MSSVYSLPRFFNLKIKSITDIIPLLRSEDEGVLYQVISYLAVNTKKDIKLCETLSNNANVISLLCKIFLDHLDSNISMETVRVIRNLMQNTPDIKDKEIWESVVTDCANNLFMSESNSIQKSPAVLLSILTQEAQHAVQFARKNANLGVFVVEGFTNADTELQHAVVQTLRNILLGMQTDKKAVFDLDTIDVMSLIALYQSDYPVIAKTALELTQLLLGCYSNTNSKTSKDSLSKVTKAKCEKDVGHRCGRHKYRKSGHKISTQLVGLDFLEKFIEKEGWDILIQLLNATESEDIHSSVFGVLSCLVRFPSTSFLITESLVDFLITYVNTCTENELCFDALCLIVKIAEIPSRNVKELLSQNQSLAELILESIQDEDCCFVGEGCSLIASLIMEEQIFDKVSQEKDNILSILCCIVNSEAKNCSWYIRVKAVSALSSMVLCDEEMCALFAEINKTANLIKWLTQNDTSEDMVSELLHLHYLAYTKPKYLNQLPNEMFHELSTAAFLQMKSPNPEIQNKAARLYSALFERMSDLQPELDSYEILHNLLVSVPDGSDTQRLFAQNIITPLQSKYYLTPQHHYHKRQVVTGGTLHWLVQQNKIRHLPPVLKELLNIIFDHHVSAKFAYCNKVPAKYNINDIRNEIPTSLYFYRNQRDYSEKRYQLLDELKEELKNKSVYSEPTNKSSETDSNEPSEAEQCKNNSSGADHSRTTEIDKSQIKTTKDNTNKSFNEDQCNKQTSTPDKSHFLGNQNCLDSGDLIYVLHGDTDTFFYNELFYYASPDHPCPSRSAGLFLYNDSDSIRQNKDNESMSDNSSAPGSVGTSVGNSKTTEEKSKNYLDKSLCSSKNQLNKSEGNPSQTWSSDLYFDVPIRAYTVSSSNDSPVSNWWWCTASNSFYSNGSISSNHVPRFSDLTTYADIVLRTFSSTKRWMCYKENVCPFHSFHLYLCEHMIRLNTIMVPFESLRFGRELECAVLFKCLCDQGIPNGRIPCSLHRGNTLQEAWVQVYILDSATDWYIVRFEKDQAQIFLNRTGLERNMYWN